MKYQPRRSEKKRLRCKWKKEYNSVRVRLNRATSYECLKTNRATHPTQPGSWLLISLILSKNIFCECVLCDLAVLFRSLYAATVRQRCVLIYTNIVHEASTDSTWRTHTRAPKHNLLVIIWTNGKTVRDASVCVSVVSTWADLFFEYACVFVWK